MVISNATICQESFEPVYSFQIRKPAQWSIQQQLRQSDAMSGILDNWEADRYWFTVRGRGII